MARWWLGSWTRGRTNWSGGDWWHSLQRLRYGYYGGYAPAYYGGYAPVYYNYGYAPAYYGGYRSGYYAPVYYGPGYRRVIRPAYAYYGPRYYRGYRYRW